MDEKNKDESGTPENKPTPVENQDAEKAKETGSDQAKSEKTPETSGGEEKDDSSKEKSPDQPGQKKEEAVVEIKEEPAKDEAKEKVADKDAQAKAGETEPAKADAKEESKGESLTGAQKALLADLEKRYEKLQQEIGHAIVGQKEVLESILLTVFCGGHALITGVPGLAKTLMIKSLARALEVSFSRIQFTPDLMPSDITGTDILEEDPTTGKRKVEFLRGPIFANLVLADEINRTPPKTQAALLQTMQERQVTIGVKTYDLPLPFHVFATQNPIDQEGTYILPEAQADRFMFSITCGYPTPEEEESIVRATTGNKQPELKTVLSAEEILEIQKIVRAMPVSDDVVRYAVKLVGATRPDREEAPKLIRDFVRFGAGPRASQFLVLGAKARAALTGQPCADVEGVRFVAKRVLSHRIILNFSARASRVSMDTVLDELLKQVKP